MVCACVDIGSNTTRLLVGRCEAGGVREIAAEREFTRLGAGLPADGAIPPAKIAAVAAAVRGQVARARALRAERVRVVATAAVRRAPNAAELCAAVGGAAGVAVEVLSGAEEARLAFCGATAGLGGGASEPIGVVDVGGGSSELVLGTLRAGVGWSVSLELGSGSLTESCLGSDPPTPAEVARARGRVGAAFAEIPQSHPARALAVGGSATSLWRVLGPVLDPPALAAAVLALTAAPAAETAGRFGLDPRRARLLPAGILLLEAAAARFGRSLEIAGGGLREGVLLEEAERG